MEEDLIEYLQIRQIEECKFQLSGQVSKNVLHFLGWVWPEVGVV